VAPVYLDNPEAVNALLIKELDKKHASINSSSRCDNSTHSSFEDSSDYHDFLS
jgi:hypothetical protein